MEIVQISCVVRECSLNLSFCKLAIYIKSHSKFLDLRTNLANLWTKDLALKLLNEATRVLESAGINRIRKIMLLPFRIWHAKNRYKKSC